MKVVQINTVCNGSTGRLAAALHEEAANNGAESAFIYTSGMASMPEAIRIGSPWEQKLHAFLSRLTGMQGYWSFVDTLRIIAQLKKLHPDVVHLHNLHSNNVNLRWLLRYFADNKIPVCLTLHDCFFFTGHCCYYTDVACDRWQGKCGNCPTKRQYNESCFFDRSRKCLRDKKRWFSRLDRLAVVGVSRWITEEAGKSILRDACILDYVYNWIDSGIFFPREKLEPMALDGFFVIACVSVYWSEYKGIGDILSVADKLAADERILLVGDCDRELPPNVIHVDKTDSTEKLAEIYSAADVFLNPSKQETFGLVTAEALSCGTPVVVYNSTACPELVGDGCGYVVEPGDIDGLLRAIRAVKAAGKKTYSEHCIRFARENFDCATNIKKYYSIYQKLLGGG